MSAKPPPHTCDTDGLCVEEPTGRGYKQRTKHCSVCGQITRTETI